MQPNPDASLLCSELCNFAADFKHSKRVTRLHAIAIAFLKRSLYTHKDFYSCLTEANFKMRLQLMKKKKHQSNVEIEMFT